MKTLLTVPFYSYRKSHPLLPDLGLGYLASGIQDISDIMIIDWNKRTPLKELCKEIKSYNPDVIGIKAFTLNFKALKNTIARLRNICPDSVIVLGGPHPTASSAADLRSEFSDIDIILLGEGEESFRNILSILKENKFEDSESSLRSLQGIIVPKMNIEDTRFSIISDLNSLPFPKWDLINPSNYSNIPIGRKHSNYPLAPIMATRGCPVGCKFCSVGRISGKHIRRRDAINIFDEIQFLYSRYNVRQIMFTDNSFSADNKTADYLAEMILRKNLDISYNMIAGPGFYEHFNTDLLAKMKASGLESIVFGIESTNNSIRKRYKMESSIDDISECIRAVKNIGIGVLGFFMIGFPGENRDNIQETVNYSALPFFDFVSYEIVSPFPGTELYDEYLASTGLSKIDWSVFNRRNISLSQDRADSIYLYRIIRFASARRMYERKSFNKELAKTLIKYILGR